ncbi:MAG: DNA-processing protein DprA [Defluviitaleaceae bacterium]|nr:DNA-processing protein DprA [Defluviitaleaceae bacterium]
MEKKYLLWLSLISGIGPKKAKTLLKYFENAENVYKATPKDIRMIHGIGESFLEKILEAKNIDIDKKLETLHRLNIKFYTQYDYEYPRLLKEISDPPIILYVKGKLPELPMAAVVGSRICSAYGSKIAHEVSKYLSEHGICVVSGMARGIDTKAHLGALEGKSPTIAVLASGVDICYPPENKSLYELIQKNGCIISEHFPGVRPIEKYFPMRNRIISGLSKSVLVVEAGKKSGSLITVKQAIEQGREVYSVPGNINNRLSYGTNRLIRDGARILTSPMDIIEDMNMVFTPIKIEKSLPRLSELEQKIYDLISLEELTPETIAERLNDTYQNIQYNLTVLELKGQAERIAGGKYTVV